MKVFELQATQNLDLTREKKIIIVNLTILMHLKACVHQELIMVT